MAVTFTTWIVVVACFAFIYVKLHLNQSGLEGYEAKWDWQLVFFSVVHLPWLLVALVTILLAEFRLLKSE